MDEWLLKSTHPHANLLVHNIYFICKIFADIHLPYVKFDCVSISPTINCKVWNIQWFQMKVYWEKIVLRGVRQKKIWFQAIWTCLCGQVVSIIDLPTLILTCLWTSANESPDYYTDINLYWPLRSIHTSKSGSESEKDQRINDKHERKFSLSRLLSLSLKQLKSDRLGFLRYPTSLYVLHQNDDDRWRIIRSVCLNLSYTSNQQWWINCPCIRGKNSLFVNLLFFTHSIAK